MSTWVCMNCPDPATGRNKRMSHYGVPRHRQMHRERKELVVMKSARGINLITHRYDYREGN